MSRKGGFVFLALVVGLSVVLGGCQVSQTAYRRSAPDAAGAAFTPQQQQSIAAICPLGLPKKTAGAALGDSDFVVRDGYVLEHSAQDRIPWWVAERISTDDLSGALERGEWLKPDPQLKPGRRAELSDYSHSGYDRGHMAPAGNQTVDVQRKKETFYLSNMTPQTAALNRTIWNRLEEHVRQWAEARGVVYVITGVLFYDPAEDDPSTADGYVEYEQIGLNRVSVPTHLYKIVYAQDASKKWDAIAFVLPNQTKTFAAQYDFSKWIRSIDWIEGRAGLDFLSALDDPVENALEAQTPALWN